MIPYPDGFSPKHLKIRVGQISYMNVAPIYYGLNNGLTPAWMEIVSAPPSELNRMLAEETLDITPVSSAAYARNAGDWLLLPDLSISCFGEVMSVLLVSRRPFAELNGSAVVLTRESATAAALTRYLFASRNVCPRVQTGHIRRITDLDASADAALVIGDAALRRPWADHFPYVWDLGALWQEMTELPFVFAVWAVRRRFADAHPEAVFAVIDRFRFSKRQGHCHLSEIVPFAARRLNISEEKCGRYYEVLDYRLDRQHLKGMERFFTGLYEERIIARPVMPAFFSIPHLTRGRAA